MGKNLFGSFLNSKRKGRMTIREFAQRLGISASYLCDFEQGRKLPPIQEESSSLYNDIVLLLGLNNEEIDYMNSCIDEDLAENNKTSPDLVKYITSNESARVAFRQIKDLNPNSEDLTEVINMLKEKTKERRPIYKDSEIDDIALNFLKDKYPEYLTNPQPINIEMIIENEGYFLQEVSFKERGYLGAAIFKDTEFELVDPTEYTPKKQLIKAGSILYDELEEKKSEVRFRTTIAHELGHMILHRNYYENNSTNMLCRLDEIESYSYRELVTRRDWEEHQANQFASCILIPRNMLIQVVFEFVRNYECPIPSRMKFISQEEKDNIIKKISIIFNTSIQMSKIRFEKIFLK